MNKIILPLYLSVLAFLLGTGISKGQTQTKFSEHFSLKAIDSIKIDSESLKPLSLNPAQIKGFRQVIHEDTLCYGGLRNKDIYIYKINLKNKGVSYLHKALIIPDTLDQQFPSPSFHWLEDSGFCIRFRSTQDKFQNQYDGYIVFYDEDAIPTYSSYFHANESVDSEQEFFFLFISKLIGGPKDYYSMSSGDMQSTDKEAREDYFTQKYGFHFQIRGDQLAVNPLGIKYPSVYKEKNFPAHYVFNIIGIEDKGIGVAFEKADSLYFYDKKGKLSSSHYFGAKDRPEFAEFSGDYFAVDFPERMPFLYNEMKYSKLIYDPFRNWYIRYYFGPRVKDEGFKQDGKREWMSYLIFDKEKDVLFEKKVLNSRDRNGLSFHPVEKGWWIVDHLAKGKKVFTLYKIIAL